MGASNKVYGILPEENTSADIIPGRYFNFVFENIQKAEESLNIQDSDNGCQFLLVNLEILIMLSERFPNVAARKIYVLKRKQLKETFYTWYERNEKKIPAKYRAGIKETADNLFRKLIEIKSWAKLE
jgi:hypothetical protein